MILLKKHRIFLTIFTVSLILAVTTFYIFSNKSSCVNSVAFIPITGDLISPQDRNQNGSTTPVANVDDILKSLESARDNHNVKTIILVIDSGGGSPEVAEEISQMIKNINKPVVALIRSQGLSGAYWVASSANRIFAFKTSEIGSIGVTQSYLDNSVSNEQNGLRFVSLSIGQFKDTGNPDKPLTLVEKSLLMRDLLVDYNIFVSEVATNRHLPLEKVRALADGSSMLGDMALQDGLIDSTGGWNDLRDYLNKSLHVQYSDSCFYK